MKPITLIITQGGDVVLPHILVPAQTEHALTLEDDRKVFLPSSVSASSLTQPTPMGEWAIAKPIGIQVVKDETRKLPNNYIEFRPENDEGYVVFLNAMLPSHTSLTIVGGKTGGVPIQWVLPKKSAVTDGIQKITGLLVVQEGVELHYAIFPRDNEQPFTLVHLEDVITNP